MPPLPGRALLDAVRRCPPCIGFDQGRKRDAGIVKSAVRLQVRKNPHDLAVEKKDRVEGHQDTFCSDRLRSTCCVEYQRIVRRQRSNADQALLATEPIP